MNINLSVLNERWRTLSGLFHEAGCVRRHVEFKASMILICVAVLLGLAEVVQTSPYPCIPKSVKVGWREGIAVQ